MLRAATVAGVERVVMTSAANTASPSSYTDDSVTDESLWTDGNDTELPAYRRSKTLAERAAWDFVADSDTATTLTTILPGAVFGPILTSDNLGSVEVIGRMLRGEMPGTPRIGLEVVDVRDVVDIHLRAMTTPAAAGERFLATGEFMWMGDIARVLRANLGDDASKVPTEEIPDDVIRALAESSAELRGIMPGLGRKNRHTTAKAEAVLGWTPRPRPKPSSTAPAASSSTTSSAERTERHPAAGVDAQLHLATSSWRSSRGAQRVVEQDPPRAVGFPARHHRSAAT